jgi:hypothetical protein
MQRGDCIAAKWRKGRERSNPSCVLCVLLWQNDVVHVSPLRSTFSTPLSSRAASGRVLGRKVLNVPVRNTLDQRAFSDSRLERLVSSSRVASSGVSSIIPPSRQITISVFDARARSITLLHASSNARSAFATNDSGLLLLITWCILSLVPNALPPMIVEYLFTFTLNLRDWDRRKRGTIVDADG